MIMLSVGRKADISRLAVAASLAAAITLGGAATALAAGPTGEFAVFSDCPLHDPEVNQCVYAQTTGGEFTIGTTTVPITKTITLQGGIAVKEEPFSETFVDAADGNTLSKTPQTVPGGLLKIVAPKGWPEALQSIFNEFINKGITGVTATTELVGAVGINEGNLILGEGTALTLPVRVHLENPFLGSRCYVGSSSKPVTIELRTGTTSPPEPNKPIKGSIGEIEFRDEGRILVINKNSLVDNSFAAPGAEGCGGLFSFLVDPAVDSELGLPSAAGHNTAVLTGKLEQATATAVRKSEE
jgi:hypothetical protein